MPSTPPLPRRGTQSTIVPLAVAKALEELKAQWVQVHNRVITLESGTKALPTLQRERALLEEQVSLNETFSAESEKPALRITIGNKIKTLDARLEETHANLRELHMLKERQALLAQQLAEAKGADDMM
ncbi:MAG: hypothetical protein ACRYGK_16960 [Janthinobacterium lividum]